MGKFYGVEMQGKSVLDVGGYDGRWAKKAIEEGAVSAIVIDNREYRKYPWDDPSWADEERIRFIDADLFEWDERADIVLCINVIYHLRNYKEALRKLRQLTTQTLIIKSSFVHEEECEADGWHHYEDGMGHPNGCVWARPSPAGLVHALEAAGFHAIEVVEPPHVQGDEGRYVCRPA